MSVLVSGIIMQGALESVFVSLIKLVFLLTTVIGILAVYGQATRLTVRTLVRPEQTDYFRGLYLAVFALLVTAAGQIVFTSYVLTG